MEGANFLAGYPLVSLSEQQFVDCDRGLILNHGCNGGLMDYGFDFAEDNFITKETTYPYVAKN